MRIVDFTYDIREGMTTYPKPWHPVVEITQLGRHHVEGRETRRIVLGTHTGTHMDAPLHMIPRASTVGNYELETLCGPACVLDLAHKGGWVSAQDLEQAVAKSGQPLRGRVLLRYGHDAYINDREFYRIFPYLRPDAAQWLIDNGVLLVGMDTPMPDFVEDEDMPIHKMFLSEGIVLVEYMRNLGGAVGVPFTLIVAPLKISEADGAPVRAFAIL